MTNLEILDEEVDLNDTSDPKAVKAKRTRAKEREEFETEGLRALMSMEQGRAWLHKVLLATGVGRNPFSRDALQMAFNAGEANIGQQIMADAQAADFDLYMLMMKENNK